jgi:hypothetical protein
MEDAAIISSHRSRPSERSRNGIDLPAMRPATRTPIASPRADLNHVAVIFMAGG